ncbi:putative ribonuclease H-like domain-containing protein, partial [Tanacetum coccineum]
NVKGNGPDWLFDVDSLTISMNYVPVAAWNKTNGIAGTKDNIIAGQAQKEKEPEQEYIRIPLCTNDPLISQGPKDCEADAGMKPTEVDENEASDKSGKHDQKARSESKSTAGPSFDIDVPSTPVNTARPSVSTANKSEEQLFERFSPFKNSFTLPLVPNVSSIDSTDIFGNSYDDEDLEEEVDMNNVISSYSVPDTSFTKFHKDHLEDQGHTQEEGKDYDEVFATVARIEAIRLFLAYASFKDFVVYQMDVKSAFVYGMIEEEVYVCQPSGFEDPHFPDTVYKVKQKSDGIFISQDKYVVEIWKKFDFALVKAASTPMETNKALIKDEEGKDVDVHLYRSLIGSLMYLTASRPDIMFAVCACARDSPFDLEAFFDSDYAGASLDRKSTTGGCQFLGKRLISWQCKKQTIIANSTIEAEYVAAANCYGQVLWIQNQMLDYGFNFMNTKIYIDNESTICIVKNPVFHSKTKHIEIRHHFIRDSYEKKLIQVIKIHTDQNVADLLTKAFDASRVKTAKDKHIEFLVGDEAVHKELGDRMERAATTASSLEAEQDSGSGPRCQDTILGDVDAQTSLEGEKQYVLTHPEENVVAQLLTDEEIIESVIGINKDDIDEEDDESSTMEPLSRNEAIKAAITLEQFLVESICENNTEVLTMLMKIKRRIQGEIDFNKKQKTLSHFSRNLHKSFM